MKLNFKQIALFALVAMAFTVPEIAMAAGGFDPSTATSGSESKSWIETAAQWMLSIVVVIWGVKRTLGFFGK